MISRSALPEEALLRRYLQGGHHTDCFSTEISQSVTHAQFVTAFYTTFLFKIERFILKLAISRPSTDTEAEQLAKNQRDTFAAWSVEARDDNQLLLCDFQGSTRSWLMVKSIGNGRGTRLYFGSAIVRTEKNDHRLKSPSFGLKALFKFHELYSVALLYSARRRLERSA